jgi:CTP:molybdopterin cytidylyltransferase MocA
LGKSAVELILKADKKSNLRELSHSDKIRRKAVEFNYPQILSDIDTPDEYKKIIDN